jgi:hypothetical protein
VLRQIESKKLSAKISISGEIQMPITDPRRRDNYYIRPYRKMSRSLDIIFLCPFFSAFLFSLSFKDIDIDFLSLHSHNYIAYTTPTVRSHSNGFFQLQPLYLVSPQNPSPAMSSATETFSAPAEVHTFDGLLSDFDGTIVDSTDGIVSVYDDQLHCDAEANYTFSQQQLSSTGTSESAAKIAYTLAKLRV